MRKACLLAGILVLAAAAAAAPALGDVVVCEPQGAASTHPPTYWYDVTPADFGRCDFHVRVYDANPVNYTSWSINPPPPAGTWTFAVHKVGGEWWASWWSPGCTNAVFGPNPTRFSFTNTNPSTWGHWTTTTSGTADPSDEVQDSSGNHVGEGDGDGYRVHVPLGEVQGCKMHYPQWPRDLVYPDENGIDVAFNGSRLADDWRCIQTGPVKNIYFWISWEQNEVQPIGAEGIWVRIHSDNPEGPGGYSIPDNLLWERRYLPGQFTVTDMDDHLQDWYRYPDYYHESDHVKWQRVSIENIEDPFIQDEGTIYWLEVDIPSPGTVGWKVSGSEQYRDDAVYYSLGWQELRDPRSQESFDLAFVITGEVRSQVPAVSEWGLIVLVLVVIATAGILIVRRRRRYERAL